MLVRKSISGLIASVFAFVTVFPSQVSAQSVAQALPQIQIHPSTTTFHPVMIEGIKLYPNDPLKFDFIVNTGDSQLAGDALQQEILKLSRYFLASLTVPQEQMWVNLSPYEKDRIIPDVFGQTEMGRDMLAQDYILKQMTSTLISPDNEYGRKFWDNVYEQAKEKFGTTELPTNSFSKVWIVPQEAKVYTHNNTVYVSSSHLKVMQQNDYSALSKSLGIEETGISSQQQTMDEVSSRIFQEVVVPQLEYEVNNGEYFAPLRQIFRSVVFAVWYKGALQQSLLGRQYINQEKIDNVTHGTNDKEAIYQQYLKALESGVANMISEEYDPETQQMVPKQYFTGGEDLTQARAEEADDAEMAEHQDKLRAAIAGGDLVDALVSLNNAMLDAKVASDYQNVFNALKQAFPGEGVLRLPTTSTRKIDTSSGDNRNRAPALDIVRDEKTGARVRELPMPMDEVKGIEGTSPGIDYDFMFAPIVIKTDDIPAELKEAVMKAGSDKKKVSGAVADYLQKIFEEKGIVTNDQSLRSTADALNDHRRNNVNFIFDKLSMIAIVAPSGDLLVKVPFWFLRNEEASQKFLDEPIAQDLAKQPTVEVKVPDFNDLLESITDMNSALDVLGANSLFLYDALTDGNPAAAQVITRVLGQLNVEELINPEKYGIEVDQNLGRFVSNMDADGFGNNLKQFLMSLTTVDILLLNLNNMLMPNYDADGKKGIAVENRQMQDAAISLFYRLYNRMMSLGDAEDYEPLRAKVMDFAERLNVAVRDADAFDIQNLTQGAQQAKELSEKIGANESQEQALGRIAEAYQGQDAWAEGVMRLAHVLDETTFVDAFRKVQAGQKKIVKPSEKLNPVIFGSGRIANAAFAIRLVNDLNFGEEGFVGNYSLQSRKVDGANDEERFENARAKVQEMLDDDVVRNAGFKIKDVAVSQLLAEGRLVLQAGEKKLAAKMDYIVDIEAPSVYPVNVILDGEKVATVYYVSVAEYTDFMKKGDIFIQAEEKVKAAGFASLDNIPRPLIVVDENGQDILFSEIMDGTPGGVYVGNGSYEFDAETSLKERPTLWEHAAYQKIEDGANALGEKDELTRFREVTRQFNARLKGGSGFFDVEQIMSKMVLPQGGGVNFLSNNIGKLPRVNESGVTIFTPLSCSSNGASHVLFALISAVGLGRSLLAVIADTGHMYTGGDKKAPFGHLYPKSTGAAKGVEAALPIEAHFTSVRTATGLVDGQTDIVGGSEFDLFGQLPYQADPQLVAKWFKRISAESPEFLVLFGKGTQETWNFTWKDNISGQSTGSILMGDIEIIDGNIFRQSSGYDNEWSFSTADSRARTAFINALRSQENTRTILDAIAESDQATKDNASLYGGVNLNTQFLQDNTNLTDIQMPVGTPDIESMNIQGGLRPVIVNFQLITSVMQLGLDTESDGSDSKTPELSVLDKVRLETEV